MEGYEIRCVSASRSEGWPEYVVISRGDEEWRYEKPIPMGMAHEINGQLSEHFEISTNLLDASSELDRMALRYRDALARNEGLLRLLRKREEQIERLQGLLGL